MVVWHCSGVAHWWSNRGLVVVQEWLGGGVKVARWWSKSGLMVV
jgi:hypothetical protein